MLSQGRSPTMRQIRVGLSADNLIDRLHDRVEVRSSSGLTVCYDSGRKERVAAWNIIRLTARDLGAGNVTVAGLPSAEIAIPSLHREGKGSNAPKYHGTLEITAVNGKVRLVIITDLEDYVRGVLNSEIPPSYHLEAKKAQAVAARTYGLHPRLSHESEGYNVCDSYLHCQYFAGIVSGAAENY